MLVLLRRSAAVLGAVALVAPPLSAQRNAPSTYAITNAKLVPVSAAIIPKGTIVIRDGLIAAIGANVAIPADARIIDGTGLTVYPGLFDAYGSIGMAAPAAAGGGRGGAAAALAAFAAPAPAASGRAASGLTFDQPRGVDPELRAAELVRLDEEALDGPRSAGITTALTAPSAGVFQGQSALINLGGATSAAMIVKPNVAQHLSFGSGGRGGGGGGGYPGSLMGVFAVLRQELIDAQRYREFKTAYDKNPRSMQRVEFDPGLESLLPVLARTEPVVIVANTQREIERALDLAKEFNFKLIIAGGSEAHLLAGRLKADNVPVLFSINFPRRTAAPAADADPEPIRLLRERVEMPKGPGRLAAAGVKFALESGGMTNWAEFTTNVQRAVEAGLPADAAIKALTTTPAEFFGVSDRMGSLDVGKIANLTITKGDLTEKSTKVSQVFVDGRPITPRAPVAGAGGAGAGPQRPAANADASPPELTGTWTVAVSEDGKDRTVSFTLRQDGTRLIGALQGDWGTSDVNGEVDADGQFRFRTIVTTRDGTEEALFSGRMVKDAIAGGFTILGHDLTEFTGTRMAAQSSRRENK
ncbi:MAG: amidohydrolase family protein [bacterium]